VETLQISAARSMVIKSGVDNYCSFSRASPPRFEVAFAVVSSSLTFRSQVLGRIVRRTLSLPCYMLFSYFKGYKPWCPFARFASFGSLIAFYYSLKRILLAR